MLLVSEPTAALFANSPTTPTNSRLLLHLDCCLTRTGSIDHEKEYLPFLTNQTLLLSGSCFQLGEDVFNMDEGM